MANIILSIFFLTVSTISQAGGIRTVYVNSKQMRTIKLKMGQSTVLRFREKPKKVVVGNSNYYNVEFIDNDLTIQPQGEFPTNLFVYGEYHTFGFNLKVTQGNDFDDLVNVRWKAQSVSKKGSSKLTNPVMKKLVRKSFTLGKNLVFHVKEVQQNKLLNSTIVDWELENTSGKIIKSETLKAYLTRSNRRLWGQQFGLLESEIKPSSKCKFRFVIKPMQKVGFSINAQLGDISKKFIVSRVFL